MATAAKWRKFQPLPPDIRERLTQLPALLDEQDVRLAYLFGSLAQGDEGKDVDLALLTPKEKRPYRLRPILTAHLGTERLDIVDLRRAPPVLAFEIISEGQCLYAYDDEIQLQFELRTLRQYKDTAWLRRRQDRLLKERMKQWSSSKKASEND
jgi:predicted nucleotidyltransferase